MSVFPRAQAEIIVGTAIAPAPMVEVSLIKLRLFSFVILFGFRGKSGHLDLFKQRKLTY